MQSLKPNTKSHPSNHESDTNKAHHHPDSLWERLAYGVATLIITIGPVLMDMDSIQWMAIYMETNVVIVVIVCLLAWHLEKFAKDQTYFTPEKLIYPNIKRNRS